MNDPLEQFLGADFNGPPPAALQQEVLAKTTHVLRRRRIVRRLAWAGAMAACFVAGMLTMLLVQGAPQQKVEIVDPGPQAKKQEPEKKLPEPAVSLVELEWRAFDSRDNRARLFLEVGHRYFEERQDFDSALRCYRQALDAAPMEELAVRPDDNWLIAALKEARQKEKDDAVVHP